LRRGHRQVGRRDPQAVLPLSLISGAHRHANDCSTLRRLDGPCQFVLNAGCPFPIRRPTSV
jgi:hypothetical protein